MIVQFLVLTGYMEQILDLRTSEIPEIKGNPLVYMHTVSTENPHHKRHLRYGYHVPPGAEPNKGEPAIFQVNVHGQPAPPTNSTLPQHSFNNMQPEGCFVMQSTADLLPRHCQHRTGFQARDENSGSIPQLQGVPGIV
jgi:hypothetical protein